MARLLLVIFVCTSVLAPVSAAENNGGEPYEPYRQDEFAPWMQDVRRGETLFFGSLPISFAAASLTSALLPEQQQPVRFKLGITLGISAGIALLDYILGKFGEQEDE